MQPQRCGLCCWPQWQAPQHALRIEPPWLVQRQQPPVWVWVWGATGLRWSEDELRVLRPELVPCHLAHGREHVSVGSL